MSGRQSQVLCKAQNDTYGGEKRNTRGIGSYGEMSISTLCQALYQMISLYVSLVHLVMYRTCTKRVT